MRKKLLLEFLFKKNLSFIQNNTVIVVESCLVSQSNEYRLYSLYLKGRGYVNTYAFPTDTPDKIIELLNSQDPELVSLGEKILREWIKKKQ